MKRSTTIAVASAAGILVVAGQLPSLPWERWAWAARRFMAELRLPELQQATIAPPRLNHAEVVDLLPRFALPVIPTAWRVACNDFLAGPWPDVFLGATAGLCLLFLILRLLRPADARRRVLDLARRGRPLAEISRALRLPRDTVRVLLLPAQNLPRIPR